MSKVKLYPYQEEALGKMKNGCILCGGVGSGKSLTALFYYLNNEAKGGRGLYIITTAKKRDEGEWIAELTRVGEEVATIDSWQNIGKYVGVHGGFFIFDEQRVVGKGAWVSAFLKICKENRWIMLSATPGDGWTDYIPVFIANKFYRNRTEFVKRHVVYSRFTKYPKVDRFLDEETLNRYRRSILVDMDYIRPARRQIETVRVGYDRDKYKRLMRTRFNEKAGRPIKNASELCYLLRECINSCEDRGRECEDIWRKKKRVIIFYNFNYELEILLKVFDGKVIGQWNGHIHEPVPEGDSWVYVVQYTAGAEGWNCITCDSVIFYSLNYSYKIMEQAMGRIDRVNTPYKDLWYYELCSTAPLDLAIRRALNNKKKFNEKAWTNRMK